VGLLALLSSLLRAVASYWELRSQRYEHDLREQSRARIEALEDELQELRNSGTNVDSLVGDRVLNRILTERTYFKHLPGSATATNEGDEGTD
tara:strand:- start:269 stop:544 length:276 start_codon:yes stop_codon:yes gene_type:complete